MAGGSPALSTGAIAGYEGCNATQQSRLDKAFADAATPARYSVDHADLGLTDSTAWSHYFRTDAKGKAGDLSKAKNIWSAVSLATTPNNAPFSFTVRCDPKGTAGCSGGQEEVWTEREPQDGNKPRVMHI